MNLHLFSPARFFAIVSKEFVQMRRDRVTFAMMIGIPLMQIILFGFAINSDPRHLPLAVVSGDNSRYSRAIVSALQVSTYYTMTTSAANRSQAREMLDRGQVQFILSIPEQFGRNLERGDRPILLLEADASDPVATGNAISGLRRILDQALQRELSGSFSHLLPGRLPVDLRIHPDYNPEAVSQYNIVPGLMGVILTMTLTMITSLAITRETERGTMENLLIMPVRPLEVMLGKILPYVLVGYIQISLILCAAFLLFQVPMQGSLLLIYLFSLVFIGANLSVGVTISTIARNQLQAVQMSMFFFLPSLLLSGFMFPFRGMPAWAQQIGALLPLTHYLRLVRGVILKGNGWSEAAGHLWPIALFWLLVIIIGLKRYRATLD